MGSIKRRPDGRWRARYRDAAGREHARHFARKVDAQAWLAQITASVVAGTYADPNAGRMTYGEWAIRWRASLNLKAKTLAAYDSLLNSRILPRWRDVPLSKIDYEAVAAWVAQLATELSASRTRQAYHLLTGSLDEAVKARRLAINPAREYDCRPCRRNRSAISRTKKSLRWVTPVTEHYRSKCSRTSASGGGRWLGCGCSTSTSTAVASRSSKR